MSTRLGIQPLPDFLPPLMYRNFNSHFFIIDGGFVKYNFQCEC